MNENNKNIADEESIEILKKRKEHLKQRLDAFRFRWWYWIISSLTGIVFVLIMDFDHFSLNRYNSVNEYYIMKIPQILLGAIGGSFFLAYLLGFLRMQMNANLRRVEYKLIEMGAVELKDTIDENFFTKLVQINFKYIDQYYLQTQEQAEKSFRLSSFASIAGLIIVTTGIIMMFFNKTEPAYVTTAAGVISEFIAAVFFYLYNRTILKMSQYHQKLVITQNISLALRITEEMSGDSKIKAQEMLIDRLTSDTNKYLSLTTEMK